MLSGLAGICVALVKAVGKLLKTLRRTIVLEGHVNRYGKQALGEMAEALRPY